MALELNTPQHEALRQLIQEESTQEGEMSVRPKIHRAVLKLLEQDPTDTHGDLGLIRYITDHDPGETDYTEYDAKLRQLSAMMDTEDKLYGGEHEWSLIMLGRKNNLCQIIFHYYENDISVRIQNKIIAQP